MVVKHLSLLISFRSVDDQTLSAEPEDEHPSVTATSETISRLEKHLNQIRLGEIGRFKRQLSSEESKKADQVSWAVQQQIIRLVNTRLSGADNEGRAQQLLDGLANLFSLESDHH